MLSHEQRHLGWWVSERPRPVCSLQGQEVKVMAKATPSGLAVQEPALSGIRRIHTLVTGELRSAGSFCAEMT